MPAVAVLGNLAVDVVEGGPPRPGGAPFHASRAVGGQARIVARCLEPDARLVDGLPIEWLPGKATAHFAMSYDGDVRTMTMAAIGDAWPAGDAVAAAGDADWVQVGALCRSDFPPETLAALADGRRVLYDGQGLVRAPRLGPLTVDDRFDAALLRHLTVLKLADEEAEVLGARLEEIDVPELLLTHGRLGCVVVAGGRRHEVRARPVDTDPTGAGDMFSGAYLVARARGAEPAEAARHAADVVSEVLER